MSSRLPGFYRLPLPARRARVAELAGLGPDDWQVIEHGGIDAQVADHMIENVIGTYALPFAVALNFTIDGADALVPMSVEEPSVVAAASNAARMARAGGGFTTKASPPVVIGQIQLTRVDDPDLGAAAILDAKPRLLEEARALVPRLCARGGGPVDLTARVLARGGPDGGVIAVHLHVDCRDAMGANLVNGLCEDTADRIATIAKGTVGLRILSNLTDGRTITVTARVPDEALKADDAPGIDVRKAIAAASRFAELDPYRACTHNKGIMNGVDAVLVATGQDWRAVEAGAHAFAAHTGTYKPLATWREEEGSLHGTLHMPLAVGTVGGALHAHPGARLGLHLAGVKTAARLAAIAGAAGLATNLAALRALATDGIQRGHMALHARVVARAAGATGELVDTIARELAASGEVKAEAARVILARLTGEPA
ncbi:MAG TPA: hydroxymethylglutaryl-CoA reductase, degradative [Kofleriaceae bacterium]|jgi:hydroxymethylglutaryl-CoA reductase|nr:hydroxymethylglutaryl-CoA reductase, degradative [Kofleriaceae bacterium]